MQVENTSTYITGFTKFRLDKGYTLQEVLGLISQMTMTRLKRIENGAAILKEHEILAFSVLYGVSLNELEDLYDWQI